MGDSIKVGNIINRNRLSDILREAEVLGLVWHRSEIYGHIRSSISLVAEEIADLETRLRVKK